MTRCTGFTFVSKRNARVLILGSLPGVESLRRQEYYAFKHNGFWTIMGDILGAGPDIPYKARLERLVQSGIALWDVCGAASREGSLDSNIRSPEPNDFALFFGIHRNIEAICFNGQPAEKMFRRYVVPSMEQRLPLIPLPSTSPAYAGMNVEQKLARWREALLPFLLP